MKSFVFAAIAAFFIAIPGYSTDIRKPGYIITLSGDTLRGQILIRKELGVVADEQYYLEARFEDSSGNKTTYKPTELKGYGFAPANDSLLVHFVAFADVEMQGTLGMKKADVFLQRLVRGHAPLFYLYHTNYTGYTRAHLPELYVLDPKQPSSPCLIKPKSLKMPTRYRRSDILPHLDGWPEEEYSKIHDELSFDEVVKCMVAYNYWKKQNTPAL